MISNPSVSTSLCTSQLCHPYSANDRTFCPHSVPQNIKLSNVVRASQKASYTHKSHGTPFVAKEKQQAVVLASKAGCGKGVWPSHL